MTDFDKYNLTEESLFTLLSPRSGEVSVAKARRFADEPEFTSETY